MREPDPNNEPERKAELAAMRALGREVGEAAEAENVAAVQEGDRVSSLEADEIKALDHARRAELHREHSIRNAEAEDMNRRRQASAPRIVDGKAMSRATAPPFNPVDAAPPDKQLGSQDLDAMTVEQLQALAAAHGIEVARGDGKPGRARKADYVSALRS